MLKKILFFLVFIAIFMPSSVFAFKGIVLGVKDGDTLIVKKYGRQVFVKLYGVDAPEKGQKFYERASSYTGRFKGKTVEVVQEGRNLGNSIEAFVYINGKSVNEELVKSGLVWIDPSKCTHPRCKNWDKMEKQSKTDKKGLWVQEKPVPPWKFRSSVTY
jgi:endonuclease YncB( thermonuclease family)